LPSLLRNFHPLLLAPTASRASGQQRLRRGQPGQCAFRKSETISVAGLSGNQLSALRNFDNISAKGEGMLKKVLGPQPSPRLRKSNWDTISRKEEKLTRTARSPAPPSSNDETRDRRWRHCGSPGCCQHQQHQCRHQRRSCRGRPPSTPATPARRHQQQLEISNPPAHPSGRGALKRLFHRRLHRSKIRG